MDTTTSKPVNIVIVTGLSGAGMSTALAGLEDMGFEVLDNFPIGLIDPLLATPKSDKRPIAIGIDSRTREFSASELQQKVDELHKNKDLNVQVVFVECDDSILAKRFSETRRRHPLAVGKPIEAGIKQERELLFPIRAIADLLLDTSDLSPHELRRLVTSQFNMDIHRGLNVTIMSFGFKYGMPRAADIVFDVRFLKNPHWDDELKPQTGLDPAVQDYIRGDDDYAAFFERLTALIIPLIPRYTHEGKSHLTIAIGCTGGKHRSVFVAEQLAQKLQQNDTASNIFHRDMKRSINA